MLTQSQKTFVCEGFPNLCLFLIISEYLKLYLSSLDGKMLDARSFFFKKYVTLLLLFSLFCSSFSSNWNLDSENPSLNLKKKGKATCKATFEINVRIHSTIIKDVKMLIVEKNSHPNHPRGQTLKTLRDLAQVRDRDVDWHWDTCWLLVCSQYFAIELHRVLQHAEQKQMDTVVSSFYRTDAVFKQIW